MVSVTSDVTASASYQAAPPKPARFDPTQASNSFAALVDANTPSDTPGPAPVPAPRPSDPATIVLRRPPITPRPGNPTATDQGPVRNPTDQTADAGQPADANRRHRRSTRQGQDGWFRA